VPVATVLVVAVGFTTPENLIKARPYIFVGAFVIGMFLTPPDVISQVLLAVPMWLLFEVGVVFSKVYKKRIVAAGAAREQRYESDDSAGDVDTPKLESTADDAISDSSATKAPNGDIPGSYRNSLTDSDDGSENVDNDGDERGPFGCVSCSFVFTLDRFWTPINFSFGCLLFPRTIESDSHVEITAKASRYFDHHGWNWRQPV